MLCVQERVCVCVCVCVQVREGVSVCVDRISDVKISLKWLNWVNWLSRNEGVSYDFEAKILDGNGSLH